MKKNINNKTCKSKKYSNKKIRIKFDGKKNKRWWNLKKKINDPKQKKIIIKWMKTKFERLKNHRGVKLKNICYLIDYL
jgi:hypothetical protein